MSLGKAIRLERIKNRKSGNMVFIPLDHGLTVGTIKGLEDMPTLVDKIALGGANAVIEHAGMAAAGHRGSSSTTRKFSGTDIGLIIHLSGSTSLSPTPNHKVLVCSVEEALRMGADGVSIHINIGDHDEPAMLEEMGLVAQQCRYWGMPLIAMMYPRGPKITSEHAPEVVNIAARAGAEMGADIVKTNYTGDIDSFRQITKGCPVPIIIAGGPKLETTKDVFQMIVDSMEAGARGVAMGRNVFQAEDPTIMVRAICKIVHEHYSVQDVLKEYQIK
jgi:fructose-bisphosphate aldolase/2-amino-3,7-dideoxy-D-threo-hept-6-ulosonate synthase